MTDRVRALCRSIQEEADAGIGFAEYVVTETRGLLGADYMCCYRPVPADEAMTLDFIHWGGQEPPGTTVALEGLLRREGAGFATYNPTRPAPSERNILWRHAATPQTRQRWLRSAIVRHLYPRVGLTGLDEMRFLLTDGPTLVGWFGGWREQPFQPPDERILRRLAGPVHRWLRRRELLRAADADAAALPSVLEALAVPAFVMDLRGRIRHRNDAGARLLERERRSVIAELADATRRRASAGRFETTVIRGHATTQLLCVERAPRELDARLACASAAWRLTRRQAEVLGHLAHGRANRTIAQWLGCTERTVEKHVTSIFVKARVDSRSAVLALLLEIDPHR